MNGKITTIDMIRFNGIIVAAATAAAVIIIASLICGIIRYGIS